MMLMYLRHLTLQNFRSYPKANFTFNKDTTIIVGPNTSGKSNFIESVYLLSLGKSFRTDKDTDMIAFEKDIARVTGKTQDETLQVLLTRGNVLGKKTQFKKFLVNNIPKRRVDFSARLKAVLFCPQDLDIINGSPHLRRRFLNEALEQMDRGYRQALITYERALRQRNALLDLSREQGRRDEEQFLYWDESLIQSGQVLTEKREAFVHFLNGSTKTIFDFSVMYDKSIVSKERLLQYKDAEVGVGNTLVGPHRDDISLSFFAKGLEERSIKHYGSRGQQRLAILQLKLLQLDFIEKTIGTRPMLLLDDIFSELDSQHIHLVFSLLGKQQTIVTTTHKEFLTNEQKLDTSMIELKTAE